MKVNLKLIENKLTKARTQLILNQPFLGNLVLHLPLKAAGSWCKTSATDAKNFYYNPEFIHQLDNQQTKFVLIHEALHCALTHFARRGNRSKHRWDLACDFAINPLLVQQGFHPPLDVPIFHQYQEMVAEEIYPMIADNLDQEPMDQHLYDNQTDDGKSSKKGDDTKQSKTPELADKPPSLSPDEVNNLAINWKKTLASSAQLAQQAGKLSDEFAKLIDFSLQSQVSWRSLLAQYMSSFGRDDFSYLRQSRRSGNAIFPALKSHQIELNIAIDTSGSISAKEIDEFVAEVNAIKANTCSVITLLACDDTINPESPWRFELWQPLQFPASLGGGKGTNFNPVFEYINTQHSKSDALIYFTDGKGKFPQSEPNYPVLWLIKGRSPVPWGRRIQLN